MERFGDAPGMPGHVLPVHDHRSRRQHTDMRVGVICRDQLPPQVVEKLTQRIRYIDHQSTDITALRPRSIVLPPERITTHPLYGTQFVVFCTCDAHHGVKRRYLGAPQLLLKNGRGYSIPGFPAEIIYARKLKILNARRKAAARLERCLDRSTRADCIGAEPLLDVRGIIRSVYLEGRETGAGTRAFGETQAEAPDSVHLADDARRDFRLDVGLILHYGRSDVNELRGGGARENRYRTGVLTRPVELRRIHGDVDLPGRAGGRSAVDRGDLNPGRVGAQLECDLSLGLSRQAYGLGRRGGAVRHSETQVGRIG